MLPGKGWTARAKAGLRTWANSGAASEDDVAGATASEDDTMAAVDKRAMKGGWTAASGWERGARAGRWQITWSDSSMMSVLSQPHCV